MLDEYVRLQPDKGRRRPQATLHIKYALHAEKVLFFFHITFMKIVTNHTERER